MKKLLVLISYFVATAIPVLSQDIKIYMVGSGDPASIRNSVYIRLLEDGLTFLDEAGEVTIPGLGYDVTFVPDNADNAADAQNHDLLIVVESAGSTEIPQYVHLPIPILAMEIFIFTGRLDRPGSLFFGPQTALNCCPTGNFEMEILNNTHPITSIYQQGQIIRVSQNSADAQILGLNQEQLSPAATPLAQSGLTTNPDAPWVSLAVMDMGATGLTGDADAAVPSGADPAPARRAVLGYQERVQMFINEPIDDLDIAISTDGAILFQRVVQWLLGQPVTAGSDGTIIVDWMIQ